MAFFIAHVRIYPKTQNDHKNLNNDKKAMPESEKYEGLIGLKNLSQRIRKKTSGFSCPRIIISTHTKPTTTSPP